MRHDNRQRPTRLWSVRNLLSRLLRCLLGALREPAVPVTPRLPFPRSPASGYLFVAALDIMQDHITRARLTGEPSHVTLVVRLGRMGPMELNQASEAIAEGRACVEQALPMLRRCV